VRYWLTRQYTFTRTAPCRSGEFKRGLCSATSPFFSAIRLPYRGLYHRLLLHSVCIRGVTPSRALRSLQVLPCCGAARLPCARRGDADMTPNVLQYAPLLISCLLTYLGWLHPGATLPSNVSSACISALPLYDAQRRLTRMLFQPTNDWRLVLTPVHQLPGLPTTR